MTFLKTERTFLTIECPPSTTSGRYSTKIEFFVDSGGFRVAVFAKKNDGGARALCNLGEYKGDNPKDVLCAYRDVFDNVLGQPAPQQPINPCTTGIRGVTRSLSCRDLNFPRQQSPG